MQDDEKLSRLNLSPLFEIAPDNIRPRSYLQTWQNMHGGSAPEYDWYRAESDWPDYKAQYRATLPILDLTGYIHGPPPERVCQVVTTFVTMLGMQNFESYLTRTSDIVAHQSQATGNGYHMSAEDIYQFEWVKRMTPKAGVGDYQYDWIAKTLTVSEFTLINQAARWLGTSVGQTFLTTADKDLKAVFAAQRDGQLQAHRECLAGPTGQPRLPGLGD